MTTKRGRALSGAVAAAPSLPADKAANGKHQALGRKNFAREGRSPNGNDAAAKEPPLPAATATATTAALSPPFSTSSASSSSFWASVEQDALAALVSPQPVQEFLSETWEKRPAVFRATEERRALVERGEVFTKATFDAVVAEAEAAAVAAAAAAKKKNEPSPPPSTSASPPTSTSAPPPPPSPPAVLFGRDVCASRYRRGARENLGGEFGARVTPVALRRLYGGSEEQEEEEEEEEEGEGEEEEEEEAAERGGARATSSSLKATLQVHQPQRWCDACWRLIAALEARLGCLVGANSYLTPRDSQGLAPHWDDVEVFVLQVEGAKAWKVWSWEEEEEEEDEEEEAGEGGGGKRRRGGKGAPLASSPSGDLDERSLGEPALEFVLRPGDVLYLPRGTVHAAAADVSLDKEEEAQQEENGSVAAKRKKGAKKAISAASSAPSSSSSNHLTISTHQRWSLCDLALAAISAAAAVPPSCRDEKEGNGGGLPCSLRPGLPPGFLSSAGFERGALAAAAGAASAGRGSPSPSSTTAAALARGLRDLAAALEKPSSSLPSPSLRLLDGAADALSADFFASRLPPHPTQLLKNGRAPRSTDSVAVRGRGLFRLVACDPGAGCCGGDGDGGSSGGGSGFVRILSCVRNDRAAHLVPPLPSPSPSSSSSGSEDDDEETEQEGSSRSGGGSSSSKERSIEEEEEEESESDEEEDESESETDDDEDDDDDDESEGDCSTLYPSSYAPALAQLLSSTPANPLEISRVALPSSEARLGLVYSLWSEGVLAVVEK